MMKHAPKVLATALAVACTAPAMALEIANVNGWKVDLSGSVNAFYTHVKSSNRDASVQIENGLLPGYLNAQVSTTQNGYDVKAQVGYWPGIDSGGVGTGPGKSNADFRTTWFSIGTAAAGTVKLGRDIGIFEGNEILGDMTLLGVGGGGGLARNINTTLGGIGGGYIYPEFQPQITYTSPKLANMVSLSIGAFDNKNQSATNASVGTTGKEIGWQGQVEVAPGIPGLTKGWVSFVNQKFPNATANGIGYGLRGDFGPGNMLGYQASGYNGKGLGSAVLFSDGFDSLGNTRKANGYLLQFTVKPVPDVKIGLQHGQSRSRGSGSAVESSADVVKTVADTVGVYWNIVPAITLVAEYNRRKDKVTAGNPKTDTIAVGGILFF